MQSHRKGQRTQTMIFKALRKTLKIKQHESHQKRGEPMSSERLAVRSLYWIPKLHKCPFKQRYIAGSAKCSTIPLSKLLTCMLSVVKACLQSYCDSCYPSGGVNHMGF